ncbi:MAG: hypothetical protein GC161_06860 [Planctomycetaceae bacterium]|nr:hypothetical protein [Planctomycetaceae bacterium]
MERLLHPLTDLRDCPSMRIALKLANTPDPYNALGIADVHRTLTQCGAADSLLAAIRHATASPVLIAMREDCGQQRLKTLVAEERALRLADDWSAPPMPALWAQPNYQAQLVEEVVELRGNVVELRQEVREVRHSAARDAHRGRRQTTTRDQRDSRIKAWHLIGSCLLSSALTWFIPWALTGWLGI